ncbi:MAG TPA: glycosyltransferase [Aquaticitalea sp.]|nr:glycosyltransferase [Aquaticitalea sp.]HNU59026.1 glycosyltransferase [Aquaticitalea sp.]
MRLSIIVPVYNVEKHVSTCLDSLLHQNIDEKDFEVVVINDGSTDSSREIVKNYVEKCRNIKLIDKTNGGLSSARNCGIDAAKGDYLFFLDSDDFILPNCLKKIVDASETNDLDILTFKSKSFTSSNPSIKLTQRIDPKGIEENIPISQILTGKDHMANFKYRSEVWTYIIKHDFLTSTNLRFEDGRYLEDIPFSTRLFLKARRVSHLKIDAHRYRITPGSIMNNKRPGHFNKLINDMQYVILDFNTIIKTLNDNQTNPDCIKRIKSRQQSLTFFSMVRMLKSTMGIKEVKRRIEELKAIGAYPLDSLSKDDFTGKKNRIIAELFKNENRYYFFFRVFNPILKLRNHI